MGSVLYFRKFLRVYNLTKKIPRTHEKKHYTFPPLQTSPHLKRTSLRKFDSANCVLGRLKCTTLSPLLIEYSLPLERWPPKHNGSELSFGLMHDPGNVLMGHADRACDVDKMFYPYIIE
jgi:hypothetical protein